MTRAHRIPTKRSSASRWAAFVVLAVVVAFSLALLTGCYENEKRREYALSGCKFAYREELINKKYCGKACFRPVIRETWECGNPEKLYFVSFEY